MKNKNIFEKNARIPDVVQQKANAAFRAIYTREDEPAQKPQKIHRSTRATIIKIASTVAVAAITVAVLFVAIAYFGGKETEVPGGSGQVTFAGFVEPFTIRVCAAELEPETSLPINLDLKKQAFSYGVDWTGCANYHINFPISVEGENISSVTLKADNAFIEVVSIDCPSIVKSGTPQTLADFRSTYVEGYDLSGQPIGKTEVGYYDSFSADYETLQNSKYLFNICNSLTDRMDIYYLLCHDGGEDDRSAQFTYLVKDVEVTIEVTFKDGTTASRSLGLFADKYSATGEDDDGTEYTYETMQIFCYDKNSADDATKQLISSKITRAAEICKAEGGEISGGDATTNGDDPVDDTEATDSTDVSVSAETTVDTEPAASTDATISTDAAGSTEPTVSAEGTKVTEEVSSTENTDSTGIDN